MEESTKPKKRVAQRKRSASICSPQSPEGQAAIKHTLHRGNSFTFLTPGPYWDLTLKRKQREKDDDDALSVCSLEIKMRGGGDGIPSEMY
ncbi:neuroepithelial cell-transforming gene 1 protein-like isoform X2 [Microcaecilia unicolor]|uniref:Neuroepithelial cell-transforming gene 1 protein-like isoform X2 n=1 Tax=Microcaecilia unicolor TaxID=1415580 RepID=A0A6P7YYM2_9AMPH|nr:neuroepithelial cell-transforming gene 1 protein-like isoform X2 [Microcaecilia unicolor]